MVDDPYHTICVSFYLDDPLPFSVVVGCQASSAVSMFQEHRQEDREAS